MLVVDGFRMTYRQATKWPPADRPGASRGRSFHARKLAQIDNELDEQEVNEDREKERSVDHGNGHSL